jgi:NMD protein affecting ribosome stability and mRNA decay
MSGWNAAMCEDCWNAVHGVREPVRLRAVAVEVCATCGIPTTSGIFVRMNPAQQAWPTLDVDTA